MRRNVLALACALLLLVAWSCGQQTWEAAMQAGEAACSGSGSASIDATRLAIVGAGGMAGGVG